MNQTFKSSNITFGNMKLYNVIPEVSTLSTDTTDDFPIYPKGSINNPQTATFECELEGTIDISALDDLLDAVAPPTEDSKTFTLQYNGTYPEQIRRHKKKRINKKWAKRYGYRKVPCRYSFDNARMSDNGDGSIEFRTDSVKILKGE